MSLYDARAARKHATIPLNPERLDAADAGLRVACASLKDVGRIFERIERDGPGAARRRARRVTAAIAHALTVLRAGAS
jgi:hypothetical protein